LKNILFRILLVLIALPILIIAALFFPQHHFSLIAAFVLLFSLGAGIELAKILDPRLSAPQAASIAILAILPGLCIHGIGLFLPASALELLGIASLIIAVLIGYYLISFTFPRSLEELPVNFLTFKTRLFSLVYLSFPSAIILTFLTIPLHAGQVILWFCMIVFANDSAAWLFGITMGKHRGFIKVSPNKSLEGFIAGLLGSTAAALLGPVIFSFIPANWPVLAGLGLVCGFTGIVGDLFESALKRTAGVKDSGKIIPGRGGFLDSFDSILFSALPFLIALLLLKIL